MPSKPVGQYDPAGIATKGGKNVIREGMTAVVTGGAQGIGRSICVALAKRGVCVYSLDVNDKGNKETENRMNLVGSGCHAVHCDVSDAEEIRKNFEEVLQKKGVIDILVNNAAVFSTMSFVKDSYESVLKDWTFNVDTNARSTFLCSKMVAPAMAQKGLGEIVNIVTNHVKRYLFPPSNSEHSYDASKYAQLALNESLAEELHPYGIRVNALCPASTRTPMLQEFFDNIGMELTKETIGQVSGTASLLESEEVAEACCGIKNWDDSQPVGQAYLLMYSEDCEELKKGHVARLAK